VEAYLRDIDKLTTFLQEAGNMKNACRHFHRRLAAVYQVAFTMGSFSNIAGAHHFSDQRFL